MTDLTNVPVRNINDLELAENIPLDASVLDAVKIPVGGLTQFTQGEALSLKQLREVLVAAMPGWVPSTIDDLIARSDAEVQKMLEKYLNAINDVSVVLDAIQGQINESHLSLELNKKIDIGTLANGAAARAQETANAAYAAAGAAADAARAEGQAAVEHANQRVEEAKQLIDQAEDSAQEAKDAAQNALSYAEAEVLKAKNLAQQALDQANGNLTVAQEGINEAKNLAQQASEQANGVLIVAQEGINEAKNLAQQAIDQANDVLDLTLEEINAAKQEAQQLTEQARQDAQALVTALDEKFTALNGNINTEISNLNAGLTQETTARQEGLAQITTTLNAYKAVVDDNLAVLFSKNETIVSDAEALATQVNALKSQVALVEGALPLKLDASVIQNYYTKAQSEANATSVAAGEITKYDSQLVIGGVNLFSLAELKSYAGGTLSDSVPYVTVTGSTLDVTNQGTGSRIPGNLIPVDYTKDIIISWYPLGNYTTHQIYYATQDASGAVVTGQRSKTATKGADGRIVITIPKSELSPTVTHLRLGLGSTSNTTYSFKDVQVEQGSKVTAWAPSPRDTQASLDANATAIQNTDTEVSRVNGEVVSQGQSITTLQNNLNVTNSEVAKKANATVVDGVTSRVAATESGLTSVGNRTTALENSVNHATTGLATKASTSALNTTNSNVSAIDGTVKGHTNQLTQLSSDIVTLNNGLATKLDSSVISNYYTKAQTDAKAESVAAGKVEEFKANLKIGGRNLWNPSETISAHESSGSHTNNSNAAHRFLPTYLEVSGSKLLLQIWNPNKVINKSNTNRVAFYTEDKTHISSSVLNLLSGETYQKQEFNIPANAKYMRLGVISGLSTYDQSIKFKFELGTVYTEWTASEEEVANAISSNSTAIQNTNAEVTRVDGRVTAANSAQTLLEGRVSNVEGAVATKAEAAALTSLTTRVGTEEGKSLSQGNAITALQNTINHATTGLATKASTAALNSTNSEVSRVDGVVKGHTNQLTQLSSDIVTINNGLATKLDSSVISNYYTKAQTDAKAESIATGKVEEFNANLKIGGDNLFSLSGIKRYYGGVLSDTTLFTVNGREIKCSNKGSSDRIGNVIALVDNKQPLLIRFTNVEGVNDNVLYYLCLASDGTTIQAQRTVTGTRVGKVVNIVVPATSIPEGTATINIGFGGSSAAITITDVMVVNANVMPEWTSSSRDVQAALDTNSTAIQNTNAEVTRVDGVATAANNATTALAGRVSNVEGAVATKAEAAALTSLTTRVSNAEGVNTSQGSAITALENSVNHATTGLTSKASSAALTAVDNKVTAANGRIDTTNSNVTTLTGRVSTVEGAVSTKAEAAALTALTTRVSNAEGVNTSQGSAITSLENSVNHATTGLASKASSSALTAVDNKVTAANGRIDTTNSNVSTLSGRVSTVEGAVSTKADASALTALTTRVGNAEGVNTSQGSAITSLENTVNHATTGLASKASTAALTATNSEVSRVDGVVKGHTNQLTQLSSDIVAINNGLATKLDSSVISNYYTKAQTDAKAESIAAGKVEEFNANLVIGGVNLAAKFEDGKAFSNSTYYGSTIQVTARPDLKEELSSASVPFEVTSTGGTATLKTTPQMVSRKSGTVVVSFKVKNVGTSPLSIRFNGLNTQVINKGSPLNIAPGSIQECEITGKMRPDYDWMQFQLLTAASGDNVKAVFADIQLEEGNKATSWKSPAYLTQQALDANTTAIENTNAEVRRVDGRVTTESGRITSLTGRVSTVEGDLAKKADASALSSLTTRVESEEGKSTSQGTAITALQNTVNHATTGLSTKASSAALTAVDNRVTTVDGRVNTTNSNVAALTGRVSTVESGLSTKADVSALNNVYTKTEADAKATSLAAGEVSKYDASLVIGGTNLLLNSNFSTGPSLANWSSNGGGFTKVTDPTQGSVVQTNLPGGLTHAWLKLENGVEYTYSALIKPTNDIAMTTGSPLHYHAGLSNVHQNKIQVLAKSHDVIPANKWTRIWIKFKLTSDADSFRPFIYGWTANVIQLAWTQLEIGSKATDWTPNPTEVQSSIDANATAISNTNTEVSRVDGKTTVNANNISGLTSRMGTVEGKVSTKAEASALQDYYTKTEAAANATTVAAGEVSKYDANLVIGGTNLFSFAGAVAGYIAPGNGEVVRTTATHQSMTALIPLGSHKSMTYQVWNPAAIRNTSNINRIAFFRADGSFLAVTALPQLNGTTYQTTLIQIPDAATHARLGVIAGPANGGRDEAVKVKIEFGNKATDWTPSNEEVQSSLDANATAIANTNAEVSRVDGRVTTESNRVTALTGRMSVVEGAVATKADVSVVNALTTRVGNVEGGLSTQATDMTALKAAMAVVGTVAPTTSEVLDLTSLDPNTYYPVVFALSGNTRTRIQISAPLIASQNGKPAWSTHGAGFSCMYDWETNASGWGSQPVTRTILTADNAYSGQPPAIDIGQLGNSSREYIFLRGGAKYTARYSNAVSSTQIVTASTTFTSQVIAPKAYDASKVIGTSLNEKASASALTSTNAEVSRVNGVVVSQGNQLTQLSSSIQTINGTLNTKLDSSVISNYYTKAQSDTAADTIATGKIDVFKSSLSASAMDNLVIGGNEAKTKTGGYLAVQYQLSKPVVVGKTYTIRAKISFSNGGNATANLRFYLGGQTAFHPSGGITAAAEDIIEVSAVVSANTTQQVSFYCFPNSTANANAVTTIHWVEVFEGSNLTLNEKASAAALTATNSEVSRINGVVSGQASQLTTIEASVGDVLDTINIKDTRSTNQPPTWYRANYARRRVSEFKTQTVIGVGGFFPGTYCNLETLVHYGDSSGGPILQTATATNDPSLYVQRYSTGSGTSETWGAWIQPIKDLRDSISGKADASVVNAISVKVDGMSSHASQLTTLTSELNATKNQLAVEMQVINGIQANYMVKMETNGVLAGFGLIQESGAMGPVVSSFGVNADNFFIGAPASNKKPFMVTTKSTVVNEVTYPAGTWIDTALIANATIGGAKIAAAAIGTAHIGDAQITNAKIANLDAAKINTGYINAARIQAGTITSDKMSVNNLSALSATIGVLRTATSGARTEIRDNLITVYDSSNRARVKIGVF